MYDGECFWRAYVDLSRVRWNSPKSKSDTLKRIPESQRTRCESITVSWGQASAARRDDAFAYEDDDYMDDCENLARGGAESGDLGFKVGF